MRVLLLVGVAEQGILGWHYELSLVRVFFVGGRDVPAGGLGLGGPYGCSLFRSL